MRYTTKHIRELFNCSDATVKNWAGEFVAYLSVTANPGVGKTRVFNEDDVRVFDAIARAKDSNLTYEEIHAILASGQRGDIPQKAAKIISRAPSAEVLALETRIDELLAVVTDLQSRANRAEGQNELLKEQLAAAHAEIARLNRALGS